jgi:beta-lactamase superfamily II metal-dependent hydrolase
MPWELEISTIDVGQGESSLLIARNPAVAGAVRTMLIDGGEPGYAQTVHQYVSQRLTALNVPALHHIVVSHYDQDHSGGVIRLLANDNLYAIAKAIAQAAANAVMAAIGNGVDDAHQVAAAAAAAVATILGGYNLPGAARAALAAGAGAQAEGISLPKKNNTAQNIRAGANCGRDYIDNEIGNNGKNSVNAQLITRKPRADEITRLAALGATDSSVAHGTAGERAASALTDVWPKIRGAVTDSFMTDGLYHRANVIDIGNTGHVPGAYARCVGGTVTMWSNSAVRAPEIDRTRTSVGPVRLGNEMLWNTGPAAIAAPAPANAPATFLVACNKYMWRAPANQVPIASGQPDNDDSIALVVRFGNFFFYTGGDLPSAGEDLVANAVRTYGFTNPQGGAAFPAATRIAAFKAGHHGSDHSTSDYFLTRILPTAAFISCGENQFGDINHPAQPVIDRMDATAGLFFYLTNCNYATNHIPASDGIEQISVVGNRSRVCGDNERPNLKPGRPRGDIRLYLSEAESTVPAGPGRQFHVQYWDNDDLPAGPPGTLIGTTTEDRQF